jgi:hypothetical protein
VLVIIHGTWKMNVGGVKRVVFIENLKRRDQEDQDVDGR